MGTEVGLGQHEVGDTCNGSYSCSYFIFNCTYTYLAARDMCDTKHASKYYIIIIYLPNYTPINWFSVVSGVNTPKFSTENSQIYLITIP